MSRETLDLLCVGEGIISSPVSNDRRDFSDCAWSKFSRNRFDVVRRSEGTFSRSPSPSDVRTGMLALTESTRVEVALFSTAPKLLDLLSSE